MIYTGEKCTACKVDFKADDDIVVCPECGSPHHRECYKKTNTCANADSHGNGFKWKRIDFMDKPAADAQVKVKVCPVCRTENTSTSENCIKCGAKLGTASSETAFRSENPSMQGPPPLTGDIGAVLTYMGFDPNEELEDGATIKDVSYFVGPNTLYYIPTFKKMKNFGSKMSFNISCLVFPSLYFANRKMWFWAVAAAIISVILQLPAFLIMMADSMNGVSGAEPFIEMVNSNSDFIAALKDIFKFAEWGVKIIFCLFGNYLYYRFVLRSLRKLKERGVDTKNNPAVIMASGGVKPSNIIVIAIITAVIGLAALYGVVSCTNMVKTLSLF